LKKEKRKIEHQRGILYSFDANVLLRHTETAVAYFGTRSWPLGGDVFGNGRRFHCKWQPPAALADNFVTWVCMLAAWVVMRSQEAMQGCHWQ
jgi:hypothetical protein